MVGVGGQCQWGSLVLFMRPAVEGKKLFLWREVLVLMEFVSGMGGVSCNLACTPKGPGGVQILETWEAATNHLLSRVNDTLQSGLVPWPWQQ